MREIPITLTHFSSSLPGLESEPTILLAISKPAVSNTGTILVSEKSLNCLSPLIMVPSPYLKDAYIAPLGFNPIAFLIPYFFLFPLQRAVDAKRYHALKLSAFLAVFSNAVWEPNYEIIEDTIKFSYGKSLEQIESYSLSGLQRAIKKANNPNHKSPQKSFSLNRFRVLRISSVHLALLSTMLCIHKVIFDSIVTIKHVSIEYLLLFVLSIIAFCFMLYWTKNATDSMKTRKKYITVLEALRAEELSNLESNDKAS